MKKKLSWVMALFVGATIALATVGVGYGLWFGQLEIHGTVNTGSVALEFVDNAGPDPIFGEYITPYTDDDNVVNSAFDPGDTGACPFPPFDDDADGTVDEPDGSDPPGKLSTCDPRSIAVWDTGPRDDDLDGATDEDSAIDGLSIDDDGDGLTDEDGPGGWAVPFASTALPGPDIGSAIAFVEAGNKILTVIISNPVVAAGGEVYSPTIYTSIINMGTIPIILVEARVTITPPYELWDRDESGTATDSLNGLFEFGTCEQELGDECAPPMTVELSGIIVGTTIIEPGAELPITIKVSMTPAAVPTFAYGLELTITGNQFNEPEG
jgi:hypothetical protein